MTVVDSSVWIDFFNGINTPEAEMLDHLLGKKLVCIGDLILTEVLQGFKRDNEYSTAKELLTQLRIYEMLGLNIAIKSVENYRFLKKKGVTLRKTIDVIIATFCIESNFPLLHSDRDFQPFQKYFQLKNAMQRN